MKSLAIVVMLAGVANAQPTAAQLAKSVEGHYAQTSQLTTEFVQTVTNTGFGLKPKVSTGKMYAMRPAKFRMDYVTPNGVSFIFDGATLWIINKPNLSVTQVPMSNGTLPAALAFLNNGASLSTDFNLALDAKGNLELTPKQTSSYTKLVLVVGASGEVTESTVIAPTETNDFVFKNANTTAQVNPNWFNFSPQSVPNYKIIHATAPPTP